MRFHKERVSISFFLLKWKTPIYTFFRKNIFCMNIEVQIVKKNKKSLRATPGWMQAIKKYTDGNMTSNIKRKFRIREAPLMDKNMDTKIWIS